MGKMKQSDREVIPAVIAYQLKPDRSLNHRCRLKGVWDNADTPIRRPARLLDCLEYEEPEHQEQDEEKNRDIEQHFGHSGSAGRNASESEQTGNQRYDKKNQSPFKHDDFSLLKRYVKVRIRAPHETRAC